MSDPRSADGAWRPANAVEVRMRAALHREDTADYFQTVAGAPLYLPAQEFAGETEPRPMTVEADGVRGLLVFTSPEGAAAVPGADTIVAVGYPELVEKWPDPSWLLALDPGTAIGALVPIDVVIRTALADTDNGPAPFTPANAVERGLQVALAEDDPDLLMDVLVASTSWVPTDALPPAGAALADPGFPWARVAGVIAVFTSAERAAAAFTGRVRTIEAPCIGVLAAVAALPTPEALAVNPGSSLEILIAHDRLPRILEWAAQLPQRYSDVDGRADQNA